MSAGEMESDRAGAPGFLIRQRYRQAAQRARARGRLTCLLINDLDAGRSLPGHVMLTALSTCFDKNVVIQTNIFPPAPPLV